MAFIVEDGSIVTDANTYITTLELENYASDRGYSDLVEDSDKIKRSVIISMDYLNSIYDYKGQIVSLQQKLLWPRKNVIVNGFELPDDSIPVSLKSAQLELALADLQGFKLFPSSGLPLANPGQIKKEKVGPIETEYFEKGNQTHEVLELPYVEKLLQQLLIRRPVLRTIRV